MNAQKTLAPALGWFSMALGATQLAAPKQLSRAIGTEGNSTTLMRTLGMREIGAGVAVLSRRKPAPGLWARVAGDAMDVALLLSAMRNERNDRKRLRFALASVAAVAAADLYAAMSPSTHANGVERKPDFTKVLSIMIDPAALYDLISDRETLGLIPGFEDATIAMQESESPRMVIWNIGGARMFSGTLVMTIEEQSAERGTALRVDAFSSGGGIPGIIRKAIAEIPGDEMAIGLRRLKNIAEVGYIVSNDGPSGRMKAEVAQ